MRFALPLACSAFVGVNLFGCGGGGDTTTATTTKSGDTTTQSGDTTTQSGDTTTQSGDTTTPSSDTTKSTASTTTTTTTSTTTPKPLPPREGQAVADIMNKEYYGYKPDDKSSPIGNYIRVMPGLDLDITPGGVNWEKCWNGGAAGRISGSIFNHKMMYCTNDPNQPNHVSGWWGYTQGKGFAGYYVNSTLVLSKLAKCTYAWDGASTAKVNGGCGDVQGGQGRDKDHPGVGDYCDQKLHPESSFFNKVPPNYKETSNAESPNVKHAWCPYYKGHSGHDLPADGTGHQCFWKGVAFDTTQGKDTEDETHMMLDRRVGHTKKDSGADYGPAIESWNEMILDAARVQEALRMDPTGTVVAVVYGGKDDWSASQFKSKALQLATHMQSNYGLSAPLPVIQVDTTVDTQSGKQTPVWLFKEGNQPKSITVV